MQASHETGGSRFNVTLYASHLSGKIEALVAAQAEMVIQQLRRIEIGVLMHNAEAHELSLLQAGNHAEYAALLRPFQMRLEADDVVQRCSSIVLTELHYCIGLLAVTRINQADRLQRSEAHGVLASRSHFLNRHAGFKNVMLKVLHRSAFCIAESFPEGQIFLLRIEGAVQVISAAFVIAGRTINLVIIKRISSDNRCGSIEEMEIFLVQQLFDVGGQRIARQRAAGNDNCAL